MFECICTSVQTANPTTDYSYFRLDIRSFDQSTRHTVRQCSELHPQSTGYVSYTVISFPVLLNTSTSCFSQTASETNCVRGLCESPTMSSNQPRKLILPPVTAVHSYHSPFNHLKRHSNWIDNLDNLPICKSIILPDNLLLIAVLFHSLTEIIMLNILVRKIKLPDRF